MPRVALPKRAVVPVVAPVTTNVFDFSEKSVRAAAAVLNATVATAHTPDESDGVVIPRAKSRRDADSCEGQSSMPKSSASFSESSLSQRIEHHKPALKRPRAGSLAGDDRRNSDSGKQRERDVFVFCEDDRAVVAPPRQPQRSNPVQQAALSVPRTRDVAVEKLRHSRTTRERPSSPRQAGRVSSSCSATAAAPAPQSRDLWTLPNGRRVVSVAHGASIALAAAVAATSVTLSPEAQRNRENDTRTALTRVPSWQVAHDDIVAHGTATPARLIAEASHENVSVWDLDTLLRLLSASTTVAMAPEDAARCGEWQDTAAARRHRNAPSSDPQPFASICAPSTSTEYRVPSMLRLVNGGATPTDTLQRHGVKHSRARRISVTSLSPESAVEEAEHDAAALHQSYRFCLTAFDAPARRLYYVRHAGPDAALARLLTDAVRALREDVFATFGFAPLTTAAAGRHGANAGDVNRSTGHRVARSPVTAASGTGGVRHKGHTSRGPRQTGSDGSSQAAAPEGVGSSARTAQPVHSGRQRPHVGGDDVGTGGWMGR